jgi:hypothetical protein
LCCELGCVGIAVFRTKKIQEAAFQTRDEFGGPSPSRHLSLSNLEAFVLGEDRCLAHQSFTRSALIVSFGPTMRLTAWPHPYRANLTNAYTKKNIQTTSRINMAPINNGGHTRWRIFATALRTTVKSDWRPCNLIRADRSVTFYRANRPICPKNIARVGGA